LDAPVAHLEDALGVLEVVGDDLGHLGEVPAVPLLDAHGVGVDLLVELVEEADGLHDHGVDLVRAELELVARQRVAEAELHLAQARVVQPLDEVGQLVADAAHELVDLGVADARNVELVLDEPPELDVGDGELVRELGLDDVLLQELLQRLGHLALHDGGGGGEGLRRKEGGEEERRVASKKEVDEFLRRVFCRRRRRARGSCVHLQRPLTSAVSANL
jgi:hypothetical protein